VTRPDALVLGVGGILGEAWMLAVLAGLEDEAGFDLRRCEAFVGTSAGSIVSATLVAGTSARSRLGALPAEAPARDGRVAPGLPAVAAGVLRVGEAAAGVVAPFVLSAAAPGGALARRLALARVPAGTRSLGGLGRAIASGGARWDGRLRVVAVELASGRRVVFGAPGAPEASPGEAVEASCAIPGVFRPISIGGREYVDGGAWSPTNMDVLPVGRGARVLCLNPTGSLRMARGSFTGVLGAGSRSIAAVEALALRRRGVEVTTVAPDAGSAEAMGMNLMDPGLRDEVVAAGLTQGRALASSF
jgi:NTE family protein